MNIISTMKILATNKKAYFEYTISETIEVGIALFGNEVKSIKNNLVKLQGAYAIITDNQLTLINCHISPYPFSYFGTQSDPLRNRILLLHKIELRKLIGKIQQRGFTLLPLKIYINNRGYIKLEIGVGKHKKLHDKKQLLKDKDLDRAAKRELKEKE
jgi:SsrA-binding protein